MMSGSSCQRTGTIDGLGSEDSKRVILKLILCCKSSKAQFPFPFLSISDRINTMIWNMLLYILLTDRRKEL